MYSLTICRYTHPLAKDSESNPEFPTSLAASRKNSIVAGQLYALRNAVSHLKNAYNGLDVEWNDVGKYL